jgi:two-component system, LytTR family, sensor kinase
MTVPVYLSYFVLMPVYFLKRKFLRYFVYWLLSVLVMGFIFCVAEDLFLRPAHPDWLYSPPHLFGRIPYFTFFTFLINFSFLFEEILKKQEQATQLQRANTETELKWLKAQVSPHFLFNALNNIYSLAYTQSSQTAPAVMKLSELMRYMLQESTAEKITIEREAAYLDNYIQLQSLKKRYANKIVTNVELKNPSMQIEPMLLINFVENAFKHSNLEDEGAWIRMKIYAGDDKLQFSIDNTVGQTGTKDKTTGIGLENIKQRLQLLYPKHHTLEIEVRENIHSVNLLINTKQ